MTMGPAESRPTLYVIAGANGSGKSTFTAGARAVLSIPIMDPDQEARLIRPDAPEAAAVEAGRGILTRCRAYLASGTSFGIETTLAGTTQLRLMEQAKSSGYVIDLVYIGVESADACIGRVTARVAAGGHAVPAADVRRRYQRSMAHLARALQLADHTVLYDNSTEQGHRPVLTIEHGTVVARDPALPQWVVRSLGSFLP